MSSLTVQPCVLVLLLKGHICLLLYVTINVLMFCECELYDLDGEAGCGD
jgi:hypothetical protein